MTSGDELTSRELEVLTLICRGLPNKEIAHQLSRSHKTIMAHRYNLMRKLYVHNGAGLVVEAIRHGLFDPNNSAKAPTADNRGK
jgi:DNA-binding NarL/FixJ family response regulator